MDDAVTVAPHVYKVLVDNAKVRVLESRMKPGEKTSMHSHPAVVAYAVNDGKYKFTSPDGQSMEIEMSAGQAMDMDSMEHATENVGSTEGVALLIELK